MRPEHKSWDLANKKLKFGPNENGIFTDSEAQKLDLTNNNNLGLTNWSFALNETAQKS